LNELRAPAIRGATLVSSPFVEHDRAQPAILDLFAPAHQELSELESSLMCVHRV
jgi:hypothetical protein